MPDHGTRLVCACGAVLLQCRCPAPKVDRVVQQSCPACIAKPKEPPVVMEHLDRQADEPICVCGAQAIKDLAAAKLPHTGDCKVGKEPMSNPKNRFIYHAPTPEMVESMTVIRELCSKLDDALLSMPAHPRYIALARTRLEEVSMHANKGIVFLHETE